MSNTFVTVFGNLLLTLVDKNMAVHCLFLLVHSALTNVKDFNRELVNVKDLAKAV